MQISRDVIPCKTYLADLLYATLFRNADTQA